LKKVRLILLFIAAAVLLSLPVLSDTDDIPSMFAGDEAWYKDSVYPLSVHNEVYYIPAELLSMIDGISVTVPRDGNVLIHNTINGRYISILFIHHSAAANGKIIENISVLRSGEMFYLDASLAAEALGLSLEIKTLSDGSPVLRISDGGSVLTMDELIGMYTADTDSGSNDTALPRLPEDDEDFSYDGKQKLIYVLVKSPKFGEDTEFPALENCRLYGIGFTHFLDSGDSIEELLTSSSGGYYGLAACESADELDALNTRFMKYTRRTTCFTLSSGSDEEDAELRKRGYIPIRPDFTVNGSSNPDTLLPTILQYIGSSGSCTLLLEDCWNSERMAVLLSELANSLYRTANLSGFSLTDADE